MENEPFTITVDGAEIELTPDNHGIAMFRDKSEMDYLDVTEEVGADEETCHHLIFRHRWMILWMGRVAVLEDDMSLIHGLEEQNGTFRDRTGFNSKVMVEDHPSEFEEEMYVKASLHDLGDTLPEDWL